MSKGAVRVGGAVDQHIREGAYKPVIQGLSGTGAGNSKVKEMKSTSDTVKLYLMLFVNASGAKQTAYLQGSNNGSNWMNLQTFSRTGASSWNSPNYYSAEKSGYKYYRVYKNSSSGSNGTEKWLVALYE